MGMVKSAARMLLNSGHDIEHLLPRLNEVLYPLKGPEMFVTACFLAKGGDVLRAGLAGHPPILYFSLVITASRFLEMIASSDDSITAAYLNSASSAFFLSVMSSTIASTRGDGRLFNKETLDSPQTKVPSRRK